MKARDPEVAIATGGFLQAPLLTAVTDNITIHSRYKNGKKKKPHMIVNMDAHAPICDNRVIE
jgi:hypothetical protein